MQQKHQAIFDLEEQYGPLTLSRKGKENVAPPKDDETIVKLAKLVAEVELMKGGQFPISMDFKDLCIYTGGVLPPNFQMPNVEKYDGTTCPKMHLRMYYNSMF